MNVHSKALAVLTGLIASSSISGLAGGDARANERAEGVHAPDLNGTVRTCEAFSDGRGADAGADAPAPASPIGVPDELSASDWSGIRAAYEANRYAFVDEDGTPLSPRERGRGEGRTGERGWGEGHIRARNPAQRWWTSFDGRGFLTEPDSGGWSWGLELVSFGVEGAERAVDRPQSVNAVGQPLTFLASRSEAGRASPMGNVKGQRVEYEWDEGLTEWYVNDTRGLEHGYTVHHPPHPPLTNTTALDPQGTRVSSVPRRIPIRSGRPRTAIQRCSAKSVSKKGTLRTDEASCHEIYHSEIDH